MKELEDCLRHFTTTSIVDLPFSASDSFNYVFSLQYFPQLRRLHFLLYREIISFSIREEFIRFLFTYTSFFTRKRGDTTMTTNENIMNTEPVKIKDTKVAKTVRGRLCKKKYSNAISSTAFRIYPTDSQEKEMLNILKCLKRIEYDYFNSRHNECVELPSEYLKLHQWDLRHDYKSLANSTCAVSIYAALNRVYRLGIPRKYSGFKLQNCNIKKYNELHQQLSQFIIRVKPRQKDLELFNCSLKSKLRYPADYELSRNLSVEYNSILEFHENILYVPRIGYVVSDRRFIDKNLDRCVDIVIRKKDKPSKDGHYEWYMDLCTEYQESLITKHMIEYKEYLDPPIYDSIDDFIVKGCAYESPIPKCATRIDLHLIPMDNQVRTFEYYMRVLHNIGHDFVLHVIKDINVYKVSNYLNFIDTVYSSDEDVSISVRTRKNGRVTEFYSKDMVRYIRHHRIPVYMISCYLNSVYIKIMHYVYKYISYREFLNDMEEYIIDEITTVDVLQFPVYCNDIPIKHRMRDFTIYNSDIYLVTSLDTKKESYLKYFNPSDMRRVIRLTSHIGYIRFKKGNTYSISQKDFLQAVNISVIKRKNRWYLILYRV